MFNRRLKGERRRSEALRDVNTNLENQLSEQGDLLHKQREKLVKHKLLSELLPFEEDFSELCLACRGTEWGRRVAQHGWLRAEEGASNRLPYLRLECKKCGLTLKMRRADHDSVWGE